MLWFVSMIILLPRIILDRLTHVVAQDVRLSVTAAWTLQGLRVHSRSLLQDGNLLSQLHQVSTSITKELPSKLVWAHLAPSKSSTKMLSLSSSSNRLSYLSKLMRLHTRLIPQVVTKQTSVSAATFTGTCKDFVIATKSSKSKGCLKRPTSIVLPHKKMLLINQSKLRKTTIFKGYHHRNSPLQSGQTLQQWQISLLRELRSLWSRQGDQDSLDLAQLMVSIARRRNRLTSSIRYTRRFAMIQRH